MIIEHVPGMLPVRLVAGGRVFWQPLYLRAAACETLLDAMMCGQEQPTPPVAVSKTDVCCMYACMYVCVCVCVFFVYLLKHMTR